jgi:hypothetical protein
MPHAGAQAVTTKYQAIIYLRGTQDKQLDDAERRCRHYASRFGWHVLETIRDSSPCTTPGQILARVCRPGAQILLTDTPDMIAPDQPAQHDLTMAIEGTGYIVHPITTPPRP